MENTFYPPKRQEVEELRTGVCEALGRDMLPHPGSLIFGLKVEYVLGKLQILDLKDCKKTMGLWIKAPCFALNNATTEDNTPVPL